MRTCTFKSVYERVLRAVGIDPATAGLAADREEFIADLINERVRQCWESDYWPELTLLEERPWRRTWKATTTYATGQEVYYSTDGKFYIALQSALNKVPSTETAYWSEVSAINQYLPYEPGDARALGEVMGVWTASPDRYPATATPLDFVVTANGAQVNDDAAPSAKAWVKYRMRPNEFTRVDWSGVAVYSQGDIVYYDTTGECYIASIDDDLNEVWVRVEFPWIFQRAVIHGAAADYLRQDGQRERAVIEDGLARVAIEEAHIAAAPQQGQDTRMRVRVFV